MERKASATSSTCPLPPQASVGRVHRLWGVSPYTRQAAVSLASHTEAGALLTQIKAAIRHSKTKPQISSWLTAKRALWPIPLCIWCGAGVGAVLGRCFFTRTTVSCKTPAHLSSHWEIREASLLGPLKADVASGLWEFACTHPKTCHGQQNGSHQCLSPFPYEKPWLGWFSLLMRSHLWDEIPQL
jgi:hypothetical protein